MAVSGSPQRPETQLMSLFTSRTELPHQRVERPRRQVFADRFDCRLDLGARSEDENCDVTCLTLGEPNSQIFGGGEGLSCAGDYEPQTPMN